MKYSTKAGKYLFIFTIIIILDLFFCADISLFCQQENVKENLGPAVNSKYDERSPVISPDGKTIYFTRGMHPENTGYEYMIEEQDIWYSNLKPDGSWSVAKNIGPPLNTVNPNSLCSVTPDGNTVLLLGIYRLDGSNSSGFSISHKMQEGWSYPDSLKIKNFYTTNRWVIAYLANDSKTLFLALERGDSYGAKDLYVSFLQDDNTWSGPMNLGSEINSSKNEYSPFLAADGVTLYYSSEGFNGHGGYDVYFSRRLDDTWKNWSKPENLGKQINSELDDLFFKIPASGDYFYFLSYSNSLGMGDIFRIKVKENQKPKPVVLISGKVLDKFTSDPLSAKISYEILPSYDEVGTARTDPSNGTYKITLPTGYKYRFYASSPDYIAYGDTIDLSATTDYKEIERNIELPIIEAGRIMKLDTIYFEPGSSVLSEKSKKQLYRIIQYLNENPDKILHVMGYTDKTECTSNCKELSGIRAKNSAEFIMNNFVSKRRLEIFGLGKNDNLQKGSCVILTPVK